jgi:peptide/nickel transport system substrate-binding protein
MTKLLQVLSIFLLVSLALGACSPATPVPPTSPPATVAPANPPAAGPTTAAPTAAAPASTSGSVEVANVPREQTVIFETIDGRVGDPGNFNPFINGQYQDWGFWQANQESLFFLNLESGKLEGWQAESYAFNSDSTVVTIKLRKGVKWSDGQPFTSDDVAFTINMLKSNSQLMYSSDMTTWVKDVQTPDPQTVVITLTGPNPRFVVDEFGVEIWSTVLIVPKHIWEGQDPLTFRNYDPAKGWPVGTGPYKLVRSTETEQDFDLLPSWWAAETGLHTMPIPKRAIWVGVDTEDVRGAMAASGQLDAMWTMSKSTFETAVNKNANVVAWTKTPPYAYLDACPRLLGINNALPPFNDPQIRWALNYAINRDQLVSIAYEGMTDPAQTFFPDYPPLKEFQDRNKALFDQYPVLTSDATKTAEIMTGKGYTKDAKGLWADKSGKNITFTIITRSGETDKVKMGPVLVEQMRAAGFDVDFQAVEDATYYDQNQKGTSAAWIGDVCGSVTDPYQTIARLHSRNYVDIGQTDTADPPIRYKNPALDTLIDQMAKLSPDDSSYKAVADQALAVVVKDMPVIPLVQARLLTPFSNTYWTNWPTSDNNYIQPGHWWVSGDQILINLKPAK